MVVKTAKRMCGTRSSGGIYLEVGLGTVGYPLEYFMIDPAFGFNPASIGLSPVSPALIPGENKDGDLVCHIADWVGQSYYPNVADFIEEVRRMGVSRRLSKLTDFGKLQPGSRVLLAHPKAKILNWEDMYPRRIEYTPYRDYGGCPKAYVDFVSPFGMTTDEHPHVPSPCIGLWWEDVLGSENYMRELPCGTYECAPRLAIPKEYETAFILSLPITNMVVIEDEHGDRDKKALEILSNSGTRLPYELVEA